MKFSSELLEVARSVFEEKYSCQRGKGPLVASQFRRSLERLCPEASNLTPDDIAELFAMMCDGVFPSAEMEYEEEDDDMGDDGEFFEEDDVDMDEYEDFEEYEEEQNEPAEADSGFEIYSLSKSARSEALHAINAILDIFYPHKTIWATEDFDRILELFAQRVPHIGRDISDNALKTFLFSAGATLIGSLKPREERRFFSRRLEEEKRRQESRREILSESGEKHDERLDIGVDDLNDEVADISRTFGSSASSATGDRDYDDHYYDEREREYDHSRRDKPEHDDDRRDSDQFEDSRRGDYYSKSELADRSSGRRYRDDDRSSNYPDELRHRQSYHSHSRSDVSAEPQDNALRRPKSSVQETSEKEEVTMAEATPVARVILERYFEERQVRTLAELQRFRQFIEMKIPHFDFDDDRLRILVKYAGGDYLGPYTSQHEGDSEDCASLIRRSYQDSLGNDPHEAELLRETENIVEEYFPTRIVFIPDGVERFSELLHERFRDVKLPESAIRLLLECADVDVRERNVPLSVLGSFNEAYIEIAKLLLKEHFANAVFHEDLSDFKRFRILFEEEAGPNVFLTDEELSTVFEAAGGVFVSKEEKAAETETVVLSRAEVIKQIVSSDFLCGLDPESADDLEKFRQAAITRYNMDFSDETDSKLKAIIARPLISYEGKLYCATEKTKEQIKQRVESLFNVGERIVYYESFFQNNSGWLIAAGIDSMWLLKAFLAKYYSSYLFYTYYFEQNESYDSERVKVEIEIDRVWGTSDSLSADALGSRMYVPVDRIEKALELNTDKFKRCSDGTYKRLAEPGASCDPDELDDLFDAAFGLLDDFDGDEPEGADAAQATASKQGTGDSEDSEKDVEKATAEEDGSEVEEVEEDEQEDSEESQGLAEYKWTPEAEEFVKSQVDPWFEVGGTMIYYKAFLDRWEEKLEELGVSDEATLVVLLCALYPNYFFNENYFEAEVNEEEEVFKVKREMDRVWSEDTAARRVIDLVKKLYITKEALEEIVNDEENLKKLGVDKRSNGYLVRRPKKVEGKRTRRTLKPKRASSKRKK